MASRPTPAAGTAPLSALRSGARAVVHAAAAIVAAAVYIGVVAPVARLTAKRRRRGGLGPRIVWGPIPISNIQFSSRADRLAGYESETVVLTTYRTADAAGFDHVFAKAASLPLLRHLVPYGVFIWAGLRYDIFNFFFDGGFLGATPSWRLELPLLKLAGKHVVAYPYGGDARLASRVRARGGWNAYTDIPPAAEDRDEEDVARHLAEFGRWADVVLGFADLVEDLPRVDGVILHPFDEAEMPPVPTPPEPPVKIAHAPNHRHYKGTRYLIDAVEELRLEGLDVELLLIENTSLQEARRLYETAHVIADQFLIGAYGLFAVEGMALGKAVVCYLNPRMATYHPEWDDAPIANASPDDLVAVLRRLVLDRALREELGRRGPPYVQRYHSLRRLSEQFDGIYKSLWSEG